MTTDLHDESKSFKSFEIIFLCRSVKSSISIHVGPILGSIYHLANLLSIHQSMSPNCSTLYQITITESGVTYDRVNRKVGWNILYIPIVYAYFQCYSLLNLGTILHRFTMFLHCSREYGMIAVSVICSTLLQSTEHMIRS